MSDILIIKAKYLESKKLGYLEMFLDTDKTLNHTNVIYEILRFEGTKRYYENPMQETRYMTLVF